MSMQILESVCQFPWQKILFRIRREIVLNLGCNGLLLYIPCCLAFKKHNISLYLSLFYNFHYMLAVCTKMFFPNLLVLF